jgi:hypothetical protein
VLIQKRLFLDEHEQPSAFSCQPGLRKTRNWLNAESAIQEFLIHGWTLARFHPEVVFWQSLRQSERLFVGRIVMRLQTAP